MTAYGHETSSVTDFAPPTWLRILLGVVLILGGIFILGDLVVATIISAMFIGVIAIVAGAFEIVHAFWTKGWGGFLWHIVLGALYIVFGLVVLRQPVSGALILTFALGLIILASGVVRIFVAFRNWSELGWIMLISGVFGVLAGLVIVAGWPATGLWVLGFLLGIDLIVHGVAWLVYGRLPAAQPA